MSEKKTVAYRIEGCENIKMIGNKSFGADVGYEIIDSANTFLSNNIHYSAETVRLIKEAEIGNDSNLLIVFYVQIMPDDFVMQLHRF